MKCMMIMSKIVVDDKIQVTNNFCSILFKVIQ